MTSGRGANWEFVGELKIFYPKFAGELILHTCMRIGRLLKVAGALIYAGELTFNGQRPHLHRH